MKDIFNIDFPKQSPYKSTKISDRKVSLVIGEWMNLTGRRITFDLNEPSQLGLWENGVFVGRFRNWQVLYAFELELKRLKGPKEITKEEYYSLVDKSNGRELVSLLGIFIRVFDRELHSGMVPNYMALSERDQARRYCKVYDRHGEWYAAARRNIRILLKKHHIWIRPVLEWHLKYGTK